MQIRSIASARRSIVPAALLISATLVTSVHAQTVPYAWVASPDVYQVIGESDKFRVVRVTWQPGQSDKPHSHKALGVYFIDNCHVRIHEGGKSREAKPMEGKAFIQKPVAEHRLENIGNKVCRMVIFEEK